MKIPNQTRSKQNRNSAFTLVELVIVLTIIVILAGSGVYALKIVDGVRVDRVDTDLKSLDIAIREYARRNFNRPPTQEQGLDALINRPTSEPLPKRWSASLGEEMLDPWGNPYQYRFPAVNSKKDKYDIWSIGEDGENGTDDDIGNW